MTEGTSQGLFVVVAIVIFGIFVGLSYTLFGDTLKPAMVNLFTNATEQATENMSGIAVDNYSDTIFNYSVVSEENKTIAIDSFKEGKGVTEINIPDVYINEDGIEYKVTTISAYAFNSYSAFSGTKNVSPIIITSVSIGNNVTTIGGYAFAKNSLTSLETPDSVTKIDSNAFWNNKLTSVKIPDSVTYIGWGAFAANPNLKSVDLGNSVTTIVDLAFSATSITSIVIPDSVTTLGEGAFTDNTLLKTVELPFGFDLLSNRFQEGATITYRGNLQ